MTRSSIRTLLAGAAGVLALAASVPAAAQAVITITGSGCTSWTLSPPPSPQTLTCVTGGVSSTPPVCTVQGASTGSVGTATALTARCVPEAASFVWTGGSCVGQTGMTCMATSAAVGPVVYTVKGTNGAGAGPVSPNFTVTWAAAPPPAPAGCSIARNPTSGALATAGGAITVTGSCSGGGTPTAWNWQRNGVAWGTTNASQGETLPANAAASPVTYTYTLTACNGASCAPAVITTFTVDGTGGGGGGGGGGPISCSGFTSTIVIDAVWSASPVRYFSSAYGTGFHDGVALVVRFTVPAGSPASTSVGTIGSDEYGDGPHQRTRALSTQSCDWTSASVLNAWEGMGGTQRFSVGINYGYPVLVPGQTYYFNIKNNIIDSITHVSVPTCGVSESCNVGIDWSKPPGT